MVKAKVVVMVEYIEDYMVPLPPVVESNMDVNACNTKASSF